MMNKYGVMIDPPGLYRRLGGIWLSLVPNLVSLEFPENPEMDLVFEDLDEAMAAYKIIRERPPNYPPTISPAP